MFSFNITLFFFFGIFVFLYNKCKDLTLIILIFLAIGTTTIIRIRNVGVLEDFKSFIHTQSTYGYLPFYNVRTSPLKDIAHYY